MWGVILALQSFLLFISGLTIWVSFVMWGRLLDGHHGSIPFELVKDCDLLLLIDWMLRLWGFGHSSNY